MPTWEKRLGVRFAGARKAAGLTQERVAEQLGCAVETIGRLERGSQIPAVARLREGALAVGVELADLLMDGPRDRRERAIARLASLLRRRPAEDAELAVEILERICRHYP
jgi:transcriptional regulator with XRE-family HTH domain